MCLCEVILYLLYIYLEIKMKKLKILNQTCNIISNVPTKNALDIVNCLSVYPANLTKI